MKEVFKEIIGFPQTVQVRVLWKIIDQRVQIQDLD
jgi:hypothetical protein